MNTAYRLEKGLPFSSAVAVGSMHSIKHNRLGAVVLFAIQHQVNTAVSYSELIARINLALLKKSYLPVLLPAFDYGCEI